MTSIVVRISLFCAVLALAACKADEFEISLTLDDIAAAGAGTDRSVSFEMVFSNFGEIDAEQRTVLAKFEEIMSRHMDITGFEVEPEDEGFELFIEGTILITADPASTAPYFLHVSNAELFAGFTAVELRTGPDNGPMRSAMEDVNFMLAPDEFHPTQIRLSGGEAALIAPAVIVDATPHAMYVGQIEEKLTLDFQEGVWDDTGLVFFVALP